MLPVVFTLHFDSILYHNRTRGISVKLGLGVYRHSLNRNHYQFAMQASDMNVVAHICDDFAHGRRDGQPIEKGSG